MSGKLYLIPALLGNDDYHKVIPEYNLQILNSLNTFVVENEKSARRFIKTLLPEKKQSSLKIHILNKHTSDSELYELSKLFTAPKSIGIISEAGMPVIADPGSRLVRIAHQKGIQVIPLTGPSSITLALAASGMNGQNFTFHGYLPIEKNARRRKIQQLETNSRKNNSTEIFIETPYRNNQMLDDLLKTCHSSTLLCVAVNLTMEDEFICTQSISGWHKKKTDFHKKPAVFLLQV